MEPLSLLLENNVKSAKKTIEHYKEGKKAFIKQKYPNLIILDFH